MQCVWSFLRFTLATRASRGEGIAWSDLCGYELAGGCKVFDALVERVLVSLFKWDDLGDGFAAFRDHDFPTRLDEAQNFGKASLGLINRIRGHLVRLVR